MPFPGMLHFPSSFEVYKPLLAGISRCAQEVSSTPGELCSRSDYHAAMQRTLALDQDDMPGIDAVGRLRQGRGGGRRDCSGLRLRSPQFPHALVNARRNAVTVDARVAPHTSASKPCMPVSRHTAPQ